MTTGENVLSFRDRRGKGEGNRILGVKQDGEKGKHRLFHVIVGDAPPVIIVCLTFTLRFKNT